MQLKLKIRVNALLRLKNSIFLHHFPHSTLFLCSKCVGVIKLHFIGVECNVPKLFVVLSIHWNIFHISYVLSFTFTWMIKYYAIWWYVITGKCFET